MLGKDQKYILTLIQDATEDRNKNSSPVLHQSTLERH